MYTLVLFFNVSCNNSSRTSFFSTTFFFFFFSFFRAVADCVNLNGPGWWFPRGAYMTGVGSPGEEAFYRLAQEGLVAYDTDKVNWRAYKVC